MGDLVDRLRGHVSPQWGSALKDLHDAADEIERLCAWRDTVDDMLTVCHDVASDDPRESINRLINWNVAVSLDPCVSSAAVELIEQGRREAGQSEPSRWVVVWWSPERREALFADRALAEAYAAAHRGDVVPMVALRPWPDRRPIADEP